jgi:hypothetical protein
LILPHHLGLLHPFRNLFGTGKAEYGSSASNLCPDVSNITELTTLGWPLRLAAPRLGTDGTGTDSDREPS